MAALAQQDQPKLRVAVITGGHGFDRNTFFTLFEGYDDIEYRELVQPQGNDLYTPEARKTYDVVVMYDMWQKITDEQKQNLLDRLNEGLPLVVLHHAIANYQDWPEYEQIIGVRYYLADKVIDDVKHVRSQPTHGLKIMVNVADRDHPITRGLQDFEIEDEGYDLFDFAAPIHPLLTTRTEKAGQLVGWTREYGKSRIVYIALGHDGKAYGNPSYRELVARAIRWTAGRLE